MNYDALRSKFQSINQKLGVKKMKTYVIWMRMDDSREKTSVLGMCKKVSLRKLRCSIKILSVLKMTLDD